MYEKQRSFYVSFYGNRFVANLLHNQVHLAYSSQSCLNPPTNLPVSHQLISTSYEEMDQSEDDD